MSALQSRFNAAVLPHPRTLLGAARMMTLAYPQDDLQCLHLKAQAALHTAHGVISVAQIGNELRVLTTADDQPGDDGARTRQPPRYGGGQVCRRYEPARTFSRQMLGMAEPGPAARKRQGAFGAHPVSLGNRSKVVHAAFSLRRARFASPAQARSTGTRCSAGIVTVP